MNEQAALTSLSALSHPVRLAVLRLLLPAGPDGLPAGELGRSLGIASNALSFHLTQLRDAGLLRSKRNGRRILYAIDYTGVQGLVRFLTENCCRHSAEKCSPDCASRSSDDKRRKPAARRRESPAAPERRR